jgi:Ca-activated chloride channel family protein
VTALYEVVMNGGEVPLPEGAPQPEDSGVPFDGELSVQVDELVRVAVRWKDVDATEEDAAYEVSLGITEAEVLSDISDASHDFKWAAAIAAFAEILKGSPYSSMANLAAIDTIVESDPKSTWAREEFASLYAKAKEMLPTESI